MTLSDAHPIQEIKVTLNRIGVTQSNRTVLLYIDQLYRVSIEHGPVFIERLRVSFKLLLSALQAVTHIGEDVASVKSIIVIVSH